MVKQGSPHRDQETTHPEKPNIPEETIVLEQGDDGSVESEHTYELQKRLDIVEPLINISEYVENPSNSRDGELHKALIQADIEYGEYFDDEQLKIIRDFLYKVAAKRLAERDDLSEKEIKKLVDTVMSSPLCQETFRFEKDTPGIDATFVNYIPDFNVQSFLDQSDLRQEPLWRLQIMRDLSARPDLFDNDAAARLGLVAEGGVLRVKKHGKNVERVKSSLAETQTAHVLGLELKELLAEHKDKLKREAEKNKAKRQAREKIADIKRDLPRFERTADDYQKLLDEYYSKKDALTDKIETLQKEFDKTQSFWGSFMSRNADVIELDLKKAQEELSDLEKMKKAYENDLGTFKNVADNPVTASARLPEDLRDLRRAKSRAKDV